MTTTNSPTAPAASAPDFLARLSPRVRGIIQRNTAAMQAKALKPFGRLATEPRIPVSAPAAAPTPAKPQRPRRMTAARPPAGRLVVSRTDNTPA